MTETAAAPKSSLRGRLVRHVVLPLVLTWAVGAVIVLGVANHFAGEAFDRSLLDDAYALAANVRTTEHGPTLSLSPREIRTVLFDQSESIYFAVLGSHGELVAGHTGLRPPTPAEGASAGFANIVFQGRELRSVSLKREQPAEFTVVMAQTTTSRSRLLHRLLGYSVIPQVLLLTFLTWWLRRVIGADIQPLAQLQRAVDQRDANDLTPVPEVLTAGATSREVERLGGAVNSLLSRLGESINAQREFAGNVAHELRTPLAGIRAQAAFALAQTDPAVWREQLQGIARSEMRASHQVDQLLALALADEARGSLKLSDLALDELVRDILIRYMPRAHAAGVDLGAVGLDSPVYVRGDAALIEGLLGNLLDNALRYGTAAEPRVTVALAEQASGDVVLSVSDNGPGLSAEHAQQLMPRGAQGPAGQRLGLGAGLGLAIVGRYADLMGAAFRMEPAPEGGLCAGIIFPAPAAATTLPSHGPDAQA